MPQYDPETPTEIARIAELFGFSTRRANQILAAAGVSRADRGRVPLKPAVQACLASYRDELARRKTRSAEGEQLQTAKAAEIEARNLRADDRLITIEEHNELAPKSFAVIRHYVANVPSGANLDEAARERLAAEIETVTQEAERDFERLTEEALRPSVRRAKR